MNKLFACLIILNFISLHCLAGAIEPVEPAIHPELKAHTDLEETCGLTIRRGVCQFGVNPGNGMDMVLSMTKPVFTEALSGSTTIEEAVVKGDLRLTGDMDDLKQFLGYFEAPGADPIALTLH